MSTPHHPDDELLAAVAGGEPEAGADAALAGHVANCARCADLVNDLGALRASLADLPDLAPSRPLRLLPPVAELEQPAVDRLGGWVRRLFAPVLAIGGTLALVGAVGTATPAGDGDAITAVPGDAAVQEYEAAGSPAADQRGAAGGGGDELPHDGEEFAPTDDADTLAAAERTERELISADETTLPAERSPWPMVLFTGVALVVGALLLRWIVVPRAG